MPIHYDPLEGISLADTPPLTQQDYGEIPGIPAARVQAMLSPMPLPIRRVVKPIAARLLDRAWKGR
jgi:hypothetical protein